MIKLLKVALAACVAVVAAAGPANAAQVYLSGTAKEDVSSVTSSWTLLVNYTPTTLPAITAPITSADFRINRGGTIYQWNVLKPSSQNRIRIAGAQTAYDLSLRFQGPANAPAGSTTGQFQADVNLTVGGGTTLLNQEASEANIALLTSTSTVLQGKFLVDTEFPFSTDGVLTLDGTPASAIPEPGSMVLLSGLGLVAGRRVMARRRQQKANVEPETAA
ncbi:MAG: PEP-CTERM sorting domain-containing protein [Planctomycetota bacterium]